MTTPAATRELVRWMRSHGWTREDTARVAEVSTRTISRVANRKRITPAQAKLIRELRDEGYTINSVAARVGVGATTVRKIAPGRPGKVPVAPLRDAFLGSRLNASVVARRLGWQDRRGRADGSRVKRTLGIRPDSTHRAGSVRTWVDAETVRMIAEAIGVSPWAVLPDERAVDGD